MKKVYSKFVILMLFLLSSILISANISAQVITGHPSNVTECEGIATVSYAVKLSTKSYIITGIQWQALPYKGRIWTNVDPALAKGTEDEARLILTFDKSTIPLTTSFDRTQFRCVVTAKPIFFGKEFTEYSNSAYLYVNSEPTVTSNPSGATKNVGESVTFSVSASSSLTKYYQWQKNGSNISGATSSSLTLSNLQVSDAGNYRCRVSNSCGSDYSSNAVLVVNDVQYEDGWFEQASPTSQDLRKVDAVDRYNAWAVTGDYDRLLKTTDGGETWTSLQTGRNYSYWQSIEMLSTSTLFVGGYYTIGKTVDGGSNWTFYDVYTELGLDEYPYIYNIQFVSATTGYAVGTGGLIIKTTDGGTTWVKQNWKNDAVPVTDVNLKGLHFINASSGWAVGHNGVIVNTTNGGASWTKLPSFNSTYLNSVYFLDANTGFATGAGSYRHLIKTTNGGTSWESLSTNLPAGYPWDVQFLDANNGYIAGQIYDYNTSSYKGSVLKTNDGGLTWYAQKVDDANQMYDMIMIDDKDGWTVGDAGEIQRTASGGCYTPTVNLYADVEFCASGSHLMVADSFQNNINCSYLWSTGSAEGQISASTTGNYGVTVTNLCGISVSDDINLNVFDLPEVSAGDDVTICDEDSIQLIATGGVIYSWNNGAYLNSSDIQNPLASPPVGTTNFTVTATDENGCSNTDAVAVTVNIIPTSSFSAPAFICGDAFGAFSHTGTSGIDNFFWLFEDSLSSTGITGASPSVNWASDNLGVKNLSLVVEKDGCFSDTTMKTVEIRVVPTSDFDAPVAVCADDPATLNYTGTAPGGATYNWGTAGGTQTGSGQGPVQVSYATEGSKIVSLAVIENGCSSGTTEKTIIASYPYNEEKICIVTIDLETGKNMVVWYKTPDVGIASYNVYRLGTGGIYNLLGSVSVDDFPSFTDMTGEPEKTQYLYKISAVDTCGNESDLSHYHKTLFLQYTSSDGGVNLLWQDYEIEDEAVEFSDFVIFRNTDSTSTDLVQIDVVSGTNVYTDTDAGANTQRMYYRVGGVLPEPCDPAGLLDKKGSAGPFVHSLSNLEDNKLATGINNELSSQIKLQMYPNPFGEVTNVFFSLNKQSKVKIELYNLTGQQIAVLHSEEMFAGDHKFEISRSDMNHQNGLYYVRIHINDQYVTKKLVLK